MNVNIEALQNTLDAAVARKVAANKQWRMANNTRTSLGSLGQQIEDEWVAAGQAVRVARKALRDAKPRQKGHAKYVRLTMAARAQATPVNKLISAVTALQGIQEYAALSQSTDMQRVNYLASQALAQLS